MVILITGASHTGKTYLAQRVLEKYNYPYLSIDHLKMGLIRSGNTDLTPEDDDALTEYLWPIIREIVKTAIENRQNLVVEGCYIPMTWRLDFNESYLLSMRFICLAMTENYVVSHFDKIKNHSSDIEARLDDSYCTIDTLKDENRKYISSCLKSGEQISLIDTDYDRTMQAILNSLAPDLIESPTSAISAEKKKPSDYVSDGVLAYGMEIGRLIFRQAKVVIYTLSDLPHIGGSDVLMLYQISKVDYDWLLSMSLPHAIPDPPVPYDVICACRRGFLCGESACCIRTSCSLTDADISLAETLTSEQ